MVELTARTVGARFLLRPTLALTERILGCLGRALFRLPIDLHAFAFLSNHWHALVTTPDALMVSRFLQHVHSSVAVAVNELHGWDGKVFGKASMIVVAPDSDERRLRYVLAQGAKEGLVASPLDWPGAHCARALCGLEDLRGVWRDRSREARIRGGGGNGGGREPDADEVSTVYSIPLVPIPSWAHWSPAARIERARELIAEIDRDAAEKHPVPLGRALVLAQDPAAQPRDSKRRRAGVIHTRNDETRAEFLYARRLFTWEHRGASQDLRAGRPTEVPAMCFPPTTPFQREAGAIWATPAKRK
jgi:hypothetical protein